MAQKPQQNPRPRRLTSCYRHSDIATTTGLCAPCLRHRLSLLNPSSAADTDTSTSTSSSSTATTSAVPELRRCKTFSANNFGSAVGVSFEPRRRSCDVRARNSLSTLFDLDEDGGDGSSELLKVESRNLESLSKGTCLVPEVREEEEEEEEEDEINYGLVEEARASDFPDNVECFEESKTMKEFIDLEFQSRSNKRSNRKDFKDITGSFWVAASVFSKTLRKWRKKQGSRRDKSVCNGYGFGAGLGDLRLERLRGRRLRETQSEVGEYGLGRRSCDTDPRTSIDFGRASIDCRAFGIARRSCDTDPRFSTDLGRISVDEARCSFDAPSASWDGYLLGRRALPCGSAPVVSVIENAMATVYGFDHRVVADGKIKVENGDQRDSNGLNQIKDQSDAALLQRPKKGFDGSSSIKRDMVLTEGGISPATIGVFNNDKKLLITEQELNEWLLNSSKDDSSDSFETASKDLSSVASSSNGDSFKKCRQWSKLWSIWGFLHRKKGEQCSNEEKLSTARNGNRETGSVPLSKFVRSHINAGSRGFSSILVGSARGITSRTESNGLVRRRQEDAVLERNRSSKFSPNHFDNGLLRLYLTPLRSRRRSKLGRSRPKNSPFLPRSMLR